MVIFYSIGFFILAYSNVPEKGDGKNGFPGGKFCRFWGVLLLDGDKKQAQASKINYLQLVKIQTLPYSSLTTSSHLHIPTCIFIPYPLLAFSSIILYNLLGHQKSTNEDHHRNGVVSP